MKRAALSADPREAAWQALVDYDARHPPWDPLLTRALAHLDDRDRRLAAELLTGCLRHRRWIDHVASTASGRRVAHVEPRVWNLVRLGTFQLLFLDRVPPHAAVSATVEIAKRHTPRAAGFINAALRAVQRLKTAGLDGQSPVGGRESNTARRSAVDDRLASLALRHSLPDPIAAALSRLLPDDEWEAACAAMNDPGPLGLRLNPLVADPAQTLARAQESAGEPFTPHPLVPGAWLCPRSALPALRPLLENGALVVQDPASQLIALLVAPHPGARVADLCAAPGGKAAHLAALMGDQGVVLATDRSRERLRETRAHLARLGGTCVEVVDWAMAEMLLAEPEPDAILIDAPCSGWGTVRHKPDLKWRRHAVHRLAQAQGELLRSAAPHLGPGGALVYSVCTFLPEETTAVIERFLADHPDFRLHDPREVLPTAAHAAVAEGPWVRTWPHRHACDGFFAARLVRE